MRHPIQKLYYCAQSKLLYTGIAGTIQVFDTVSGALLKQWDAPPPPTVISKKQKQQQQQQQQKISEAGDTTTDDKDNKSNNAQPETANADSIGDEEGVAVKKRKVDDITCSSTVVASVVEAKSVPEPTQKRKKVSFREAPGMGGWSANKGSNLITNMVGTSSGRHLVVATNEDKTVRVFRVLELIKGRDVWASAGGVGETVDGELQLLSERQMPKRLCALQLIEKKPSMTEEEEISADGVVIICGDKFGDVYSLPLIHNPEDNKTSTPASGFAPDVSSATPEQERKAPRDTGIITTARNKRAAQKSNETNSRNSIANLEAKELQFKHKLLLGHVSLLLDVLPVTIEVQLPDGERKQRTWILSADKDEHIRITRYPQSFVIEGFCFGHTSYVAKLLTPSWNKNVLISGGGDDYLVRWDWRAGKIEQKLDLKEHVSKVLDVVKENRSKLKESSINQGAMEIDSEESKVDDELLVSVTGLWEFRNEVHGQNQVLVSVEGLPALFVFTESVTGAFKYTSTEGVSGNVLDITVLDDKILVGVDSQSTSYQLPALMEASEASNILVDCLEPHENGHFTLITGTEPVPNINHAVSWEIAGEQKQKLDEFLYAAKHLRKFEGDSVEKGGD